jgi:hypothetical protein
MTEGAARLMDEVLPDVPLRQWVLSLPYQVRVAPAFDSALASAVRRIFVRALFDFLRARRARRRPGTAPGAIVLAPRFGSALDLYRHFHALVLDGIYTPGLHPLAPPRFQPAPSLTDQDVVGLADRARPQRRQPIGPSDGGADCGPARPGSRGRIRAPVRVDALDPAQVPTPAAALRERGQVVALAALALSR